MPPDGGRLRRTERLPGDRWPDVPRRHDRWISTAEWRGDRGQPGIGRCIALELASKGVSVAIAARTLEAGSGRMPGSLHETADAIRSLGPDAFPVACRDLNEVEHVGDLAAEAMGWKGRVDILVNNAAFLGRATFYSLDELSWRTGSAS